MDRVGGRGPHCLGASCGAPKKSLKENILAFDGHQSKKNHIITNQKQVNLVEKSMKRRWK
jgi:hypothetical protein